MVIANVYPYFEPLNHSFWLHCFRSVFGPDNVRFTISGFPSSHGFWKSGALKVDVQDGHERRRIFIDHWDLPEFDQEGMAWCDVYAKTNIDPASVPSQGAAKIVPAGPSFPVRICGKALAQWTAVNTLRQLSGVARFREVYTRPRLTAHFTNWYSLAARRLPAEAYRPGRSSSDYVFFNSTLWKNEDAANDARATFIRACRSIDGIRFEGGLTQRRGFDAYRDVATDESWHHAEFVAKTQASVLAFNTPAVARCNSWRLGEYLALGKAIVSLPIERMLPAPLIHGCEIYYVEPAPESIREAVLRIYKDQDLRKKLEQGARDYYLRHLSPAVVIRRLFGEFGDFNCASRR
jgi:hypothetical protein